MEKEEILKRKFFSKKVSNSPEMLLLCGIALLGCVLFAAEKIVTFCSGFIVFEKFVSC